MLYCTPAAPLPGRRRRVMSDELALANDGYPLHGLPLTPTGVQKLILELFSGQTLERHQIAAAIEKMHLERGGAASRTNVTNVVMRALAALRDSGQASNPTHGFWRITSTQIAPEVPLPCPRPQSSACY